MKYKSLWIIILSSVIVVSLWATIGLADDPIDKTYLDARGDVYEISTNAIVGGHDNIDIVKVFSTAQNGNLTLSLKVAGEIKNFTEGFSYWFYLDTSGDGIEDYEIGFLGDENAGITRLADEAAKPLFDAFGEGTQSLTITLPLSDLGNVQSYDFYAQSSQETEVEGLEDSAPDLFPGRPKVLHYDPGGNRVDDIFVTVTSPLPNKNYHLGDSILLEGTTSGDRIITRVLVGFIAPNGTQENIWFYANDTSQDNGYSTWNFILATAEDKGEEGYGEWTLVVRAYNDDTNSYGVATVNVKFVQESDTNGKPNGFLGIDPLYLIILVAVLAIIMVIVVIVKKSPK